MSYQTQAKTQAFLMGSCKISIPSSSADGYVELGSAKGVKITESFDSWVIKPDNTPEIIKGVKNQKVTVEGELFELDFQKFARMRGGIDTFSTTTFVFDTGGLMTVTPQALYLVHTAGPSSSNYIAVQIYYAGITEGMTIPFPADDATDIPGVPFKLVGTCQSSRTAGAQLMTITDMRSSVYTDTSFPYASTSYMSS